MYARVPVDAPPDDGTPRPVYSPYAAHDSNEMFSHQSYNNSYYFSPGPAIVYPVQKRGTKALRRKKCFDYTTTVILLLVWATLTISCAILLWLSYAVSLPTSHQGALVTADEIAGTILLSSPSILLATVLNEVLVDRCWRRVVYCALGRRPERATKTELARNLRAANFEWLMFSKRAFQCRLSLRDLRSFASYCLLRWGTAVSIASIQLCISWRELDGTDTSDQALEYTAKKRYYWILGPLVLHSISVFGTMLIWFMPPWTFFSDRFCDEGLLLKYQPYLDTVQGGSVAKYDAVARMLGSKNKQSKSLARVNMPGAQFVAKCKGIWLGLLLMFTLPTIAWVVFRFKAPSDPLRNGMWRFALHFIFLAQNITYLLALDFVIWNLSIEGLSKGLDSDKVGKPNKNLRHLGTSSGIMLLVKALKQRRPRRAALFLWLFWIQACLFRCLTVLYTLCASAFRYGSAEDRSNFYNPYFWIGWIVITAVLVLPFFGFWLVTSFQAPICEQDGWRWAKIAQHALTEPGYYGIKGGRAAWGSDVTPFASCKGTMLA